MRDPSDGSVGPAEFDAEQAWDDALMAAALLAVDPKALGGVVVRSGAGPVRDLWLTACRAIFPNSVPFVRMPAQIGPERVLGGLDLAATLRHGRPVHQAGLLSQADGGVVVMPMAERLTAATIALMAAALDQGEVAIERDGISARSKARFGLIAFDESVSEAECISPAIGDRLAFHIDLVAVPLRCAQSRRGPNAATIAAARRLASGFESQSGEEDLIAGLIGASIALGIESLRVPLLALWAARAAAALRGETSIEHDDLQLAARLVLAPRATRFPEMPQDESDGRDQPQDRHEPQGPLQSDSHEHENSDDTSTKRDAAFEDVLLEAAAAALPRDLLAQLAQAASQSPRTSRSNGQSGPARRTRKRGRPIGVGRGELGSGDRLAIVDTLRAAAPWQRLRKAVKSSPIEDAEQAGQRRFSVRPDDFRFRRYAQRSESLNIFVVDASGSTALHRLGEAKGAVELLLADSYVRRDSVALIALRGRQAELVLPPTRALTRAKRSLAGLPGGGGTPLASGIDQAIGLALAARRRDQQPTIIILTDGAANVARDGGTGRRTGEDDALVAGRHVRSFHLSALLIDTGPRPSPFASRLAAEMNGRYFALPMADAKALSNIVKRASADA
ncbi:MAG: magnesium chelatase subunit D [Alphaproteobacteria bacterium]|nr:magnesium chelatase subunit D [Alphaproteobacteria bacterium]